MKKTQKTMKKTLKSIRKQSKKILNPKKAKKLQKQTKKVGCKGSPNSLVLEMTKSAFKLACLLSRTEKSIQIYQFFIDLEKYIFAFMQYENEYLNELANAKPPLKSIEADEHIDDRIDLSAFPQISVNSYDNSTVMYLFYLRRYRALKFGISTDLHNRAQRHYRAFGEKPGDVRLVYVLETEHASSIEHSTKHACIQNGWKRHDIIINGSVQTEIIDLNKTSIDAVIQLMNSLLQQHLSLKRKHENEIIERNEQYIELEKERLRVESKKIDLEMKKMEAELESKRIETELQLKKMDFELKSKKMKI